MEKPTSIAELRKKAKLPAKQAGGSTVAEFFEANRKSMAAVLPKHMDVERMTKIALTALRNTPKLMEATTESLMGAVMQCAQFGLEPNTVQGHAYLIPFKNNKQNRTDVQVIIGYKGLIDLARRSGQIVSIAAHAVFENDKFEFQYGIDEKLNHTPALNDRGEIIAFYAIAHLKGGGYSYEVMSKEQIDKVRDNSSGYMQALKYAKKKDGEITYMNSPWWSDYEQMGRKTVIRRLSKYLPMSIEVAEAVALDAMADNGTQNMADVLTGEFRVVEEGDLKYEEEADEGGTEEKLWPEQFTDEDTGETSWVDSSGAFYDPEAHAWNTKGKRPDVKTNGEFKAKPGTAKKEPSSFGDIE